MKAFESDLILTKNTVFDESIIVTGNIISKNGSWDIKANNIDSWNIDADNIKAWDIDADNIKANNIKANNIICETRILINKNSKTTCRIFIINKSKIPIKEQIINKEEKL